MYLVQMAQDFFFGMGQPQANEWIHRLTFMPNQTSGHAMQFPARKPRDNSVVLAVRLPTKPLDVGKEEGLLKKEDLLQSHVTMARSFFLRESLLNTYISKDNT